MVLTRRSGALGALLAVALLGGALGGCSQSLFDNHGPGGGRGSGGDPDAGPDVPSTCPETCLGDAAAEFGAAPDRWRYLEDHRDRTWAAMTGGATRVTGVDPGNAITTCKQNPGAEACARLSGALLVSSSDPSGADTAIEFTAPENQVIQLSVRAYLPASGGATLRLYRNSREDALFTLPLTAQAITQDAIVLDALAGDRFLVAIAPAAGQAVRDVGLEFFVNATGTPFPSTCQLALPFPNILGNTTEDVCGKMQFTHLTYTLPPPSPSTQTPMAFGSGPFPEQHDAADLTKSSYLVWDNNARIDWSHEVTVQFWVQVRTLEVGVSNPWLFDDHDADTNACGGIGLELNPDGAGGANLILTACINPPPEAPSQMLAAMSLELPPWRFLRIVRTADSFDVCIDGKLAKRVPLAPALMMKTTNPAHLGRAVFPSPEGAFFDGLIDDVRVLTGALPCK